MNVAEYYDLPRINLTGPVNETMIQDLDRQIKSVAPSPDQGLVLTLTTGGGSVGFARAIYEELSLLQEQTDVTLVARGICLSAGVTVAMAIPQERRFATPNTKFLIHEGWQNNEPKIIGPLSAREIQAHAFETDFADDQMEARWVLGLIAKGCKQPLPTLRKQMKNGLWLTGAEAVNFGMVSGLVGGKKRTKRRV